MEAFLVSTGIVSLAEIGDKTQLLALLLTAKFKKPLPIVAGIPVANLANHGFAGALGGLITLVAKYDSLPLVVAAATLGMMLANVPAVFLGDRAAQRISLRLVHGVAAAIFAALGAATLLGTGLRLGF